MATAKVVDMTYQAPRDDDRSIDRHTHADQPWNMRLSILLAEIANKLSDYIYSSPDAKNLNTRDRNYMVKSTNIARFMGDVIFEQYKEDPNLPEVYYLAIVKEFPSLLPEHQGQPSVLEAFHFHQKCWTMLNDRYFGKVYKSPSKGGFFSGILR